MSRNDAVWYVALSLFLLAVTDLKAQTKEEEAKAAFEQVQGAAVGKGAAASPGGAVKGQYGTKEFKGALSASEKKGIDGKAPPAPGSKEGVETRPGEWAKTGAKAGAVVGGVIGALAGGSVSFGGLAIPGWAVGAGAGAAVGGLIGYGFGKIAQGMDSMVSARNKVFDDISK